MRRTTWIPLALGLCLAAAPAKAVNDWTSIGPEGGHIPALEADPQQAGVLYAGTDSGVFKSVDGGATWFRSSEGLKRSRINDIEVAPSDSSVVYAASQGLYVSRNGGATWTGPMLRERHLSAVAIDPRDPQRIWAGGQGLWLSEDGGATWSGIESDLIALVMDIILDPFDPETVYLTTLALENYGVHGVVKSTDGGATWVDTTKDNWPSFFLDYGLLAVDPTTPGVLYVSFLEINPEYDEVTWRSTNRGATWEPTEGGYPVAVDRHGVVYAGDMRSTDHGATWQPGGTLPPDFTKRFAVSAAGDGTLWAATQSLGVFVSQNSGVHWQPARDHLYATTVSSFTINTRRPNVIYAGASMAGVFKTFDGGADWTRTDADLPAEVRGVNLFASQLLAIDPRRPQTLYLSWHSGGLARSDDSGATWTVVREENPISALYSFSPLQIAVDPGASNIVYLAGLGVGDPDEYCTLSRSEDRGETFECVPPFRSDDFPSDVKRIFFDPKRPAVAWVPQNRERFWKGTEHGEQWKAVRTRGLEHAGDPVSLAIDQSGRMFLGTQAQYDEDRSERVWRSTDGGRSWQPWGRGIPARSRVTELLIDARNPNILYAAVAHHHDLFHPETDASGVYWSRDGGKTFRPAGLSGAVLQLTQDPKVPGKIYASVRGRGIYTWTRP